LNFSVSLNQEPCSALWIGSSRYVITAGTNIKSLIISIKSLTRAISRQFEVVLYLDDWIKCNQMQYPLLIDHQSAIV
jgi:hypothetical protein